MILWVDTQLSPALARWLSETFGIMAHAVRDLGLREAKDLIIFHAAREAGAVVMSKDSDFVMLLERFGPPPQVLWVTCGNTSNARMRAFFSRAFQKPKSGWSRASHSSRSVMRAKRARRQAATRSCQIAPHAYHDGSGARGASGRHVGGQKAKPLIPTPRRPQVDEIHALLREGRLLLSVPQFSRPMCRHTNIDTAAPEHHTERPSLA